MNCATHGQSPGESSINSSISVKKKTKNKKKQPATSDDISSVLSALHNSGSKSTVQSLIEPCSDSFVTKAIGENFPPFLTELRKDVALHMDYKELIALCKAVDISISEEQAKAGEAATRGQASCKLWFRFRAGRITASKMKRDCVLHKSTPTGPELYQRCVLPRVIPIHI